MKEDLAAETFNLSEEEIKLIETMDVPVHRS
jgi:hypothetical protein